MPQVDPANIEKNVKFRAAYTDRTFNDKMDGLVRRDGVLAGLQVSAFSSTELKVTAGAFLQEGLIVEMTSDLIMDTPVVALPWTVYGYSDDSENSSPVTIAVATSGSEPAGSVILATSEGGELFEMSHQLSIKAIREELDLLEADPKPRINLLTNPGFELIHPKKGIVFTMQGPCMDGWTAENLSNTGGSSQVEVTVDPDETRQGGAAALLTSESYSDPGGTNPDGTTYPAAVYSTASIWQSLDGYEEYIGKDLTLAVWLKLRDSHAEQLHDMEISIYGSSIGGPGFSDTPVDKASYVIPSYTLTHSWQLFKVTAKIENLNAGLAAYPLPAFPGISIRVAYVNSEPDGSSITTDEVLIDEAMLYLGDVSDPSFSPVPREQDWLAAESLFEAATLEEIRTGASTDLEYVMGVGGRFRTKKQGVPTVSYELLEVTQEGSPESLNSEADYDKLVEAPSSEEYRLRVSKLIAGYRPSRVKAVIRAQG